ncbi:MAG: uroporphyrinogen decarboxylase family protein [Aestuariivirga sp.]|uniref:uroporphyrinogen decarboxylase family protein n=1 Tax=Aestuariivirga sp. TaxID=2650926 RepID=UPI003018256B
MPLFIGTSGVTTLLGPAYERLKTHLGVRGGPPRWLSRPLQYAWLDEEVFQKLGSDARPMVAGPVPASPAREVSPTELVDAWGCVWKQREGVPYYEIVEPPLQNATREDIACYPWPDLANPARFHGLAARCKAIQDAGHAVVFLSGLTLFEQAYIMRGIENYLADMLADEDFFTALIARMKALAIPTVRALLKEVGAYVDVLVTGDDLGTQESTLMAPADYRRLIKPHQAEYLAEIRMHTKAKIFFHSDGDILPLLGDLAEIGVDIINPVQVNAGKMADTARLKREFGKRLSFCGAIDTGWVLPRGTTEDVRAEVRRRIRDLAPGGGYIASAVHCIQPDVPPENMLAMCDAVREFGRYPINP